MVAEKEHLLFQIAFGIGVKFRFLIFLWKFGLEYVIIVKVNKRLF